jgi:hypothetical protein
MSDLAPSQVAGKYFMEAHALFIWGPTRTLVNRVVRILAERFDREFLHIGLLEPDGPIVVDSCFADLTGERSFPVWNARGFLPDPSTRNLSALVAHGSSTGPDEDIDALLLPQELRMLVQNLSGHDGIRAIAITDSDRIGPLAGDTVRAFGEVDRFLKSVGISLIVGHCGPSVPNGELSVAFDCILSVSPNGITPKMAVVTNERGTKGFLLPTNTTQTVESLERLILT